MIKKERFFVLSALLLFWGGVLFFSGTITSGYHLVDDHEIIRFASQLSQTNTDFLSLAKKQIMADSKIRFRPFYYLHRIFVSMLFGADFAMWHASILALAVLTCFLLYLFARKIGFAILEAAVFAFLPFIGEQAEIWWRLGPAETIGVVMLAIALFFMGRATTLLHSRTTNTVFFIIFAMVASFSKESFILCIPALVFWYLVLQKHRAGRDWPSTIKHHLPVPFILLLIALIEIIHIVFFVGTADIGYAGVDRVSVAKIFQAAKYLIVRNGFGVIMIVGLLMAIVCGGRNKARLLRQMGMPAILFVLFAFPQMALYAKSGLVPRYLLPASFGISAFSAYLIRYMRENNILLSLSRLSRTGLIGFMGLAGAVLLGFGGVLLYRPSIPVEVSSHVPGALLLGIVLFYLASVLFQRRHAQPDMAASRSLIFLFGIVFVFNFGLMYSEATEFAVDGRDTNHFLSALVENSERADGPILIAADPVLHYEATYAISTYLNHAGFRHNLYVKKCMVQNGHTPFEQDLIENFAAHAQKFGLRVFHDETLRIDFCRIALLPRTEAHFIESAMAWFQPENYDRISYGPYTIYSCP